MLRALPFIIEVDDVYPSVHFFLIGWRNQKGNRPVLTYDECPEKPELKSGRRGGESGSLARWRVCKGATRRARSVGDPTYESAFRCGNKCITGLGPLSQRVQEAATSTACLYPHHLLSFPRSTYLTFIRVYIIIYILCMKIYLLPSILFVFFVVFQTYFTLIWDILKTFTIFI